MAKTLVTDTDISLSSLHQQLLIKPAASNDSTTVVQIQNSAGTVVLNVDTTNNRVGIGTASPGALLHVSKDQNGQTAIRFDNPNAGTAASALFDMRNGALGDNDRLLFGVTGTAYTSVTGWGDAGVLTAQANISGGLILNANAGGIKFETGANGSANQRMVITNSGNVGIGQPTPGSLLSVNGRASANLFGSETNCSSSAGPAVCAAAAAGSVVIPAAGTDVTVNTTAVTANSQIFAIFDQSLGTKLGVTCNSTTANPHIGARVAGTSFTIHANVSPVTNPACFSYFVIN